MKKIIVLIGAVTALLLAVSPLLMGLIISDSRTETTLRELTGQTGLKLQMESSWFTSQGRVTVTAPVIAGVTYDDITLVADVTVAHGPLLLTNTGLRPGIAWAHLTPIITGLPADHPLQQLFADGTTSTVTVLAGLTGALQLALHAASPTFTLPAAQYNLTEPTTMTLQDLQASLALARNGAADLYVSSNEVQVRNSLYVATATQATLHAHSTELSATPLPGSLHIAAQQLQIDDVPGAVVSTSAITGSLTMHGISIDYAARQQADTQTITLEQTLDVARIEASLPLESLNMHTELTGIDEALATEYLTFLRETQSTMQAMTAPQLQEHIAEHSETLALHLLQAPMQQTSTLKLQAWGGAHEATLDMRWPGMPSLTSLEQIDADTMLQMLVVTLEIAASAETVATSPLAAAAQAYTTQGLLIEDNGKIVLKASLQDGNLDLNGNSFPLGPFLNFR
ncbi:MAG: DUF945 family protein [Pseudomonadota bacterium]